jgi:hypothetical protein
MNQHTDLVLKLRAWFDADAPVAAPDALLDGVFEVTRRQRPMPAWRALLTVPVMRTPGVVLVGSPSLRLVRVIVMLVALASLLGVGGLVGVGALNRPHAIDVPSDYRLVLAATDLAVWQEEIGPDMGPGKRYLARSPGSGLPGDFLGDLTVERPEYVYDVEKSRVAAPDDLVAWLVGNGSLEVTGVAYTTVGGREATMIDALPVFPPGLQPGSWEAHYQNLLPTLYLDVGWQYRFVLVDLGEAGWLVATCGAERQLWSDAAPACEELLSTWEWVYR